MICNIVILLCSYFQIKSCFTMSLTLLHNNLITVFTFSDIIQLFFQFQIVMLLQIRMFFYIVYTKINVIIVILNIDYNRRSFLRFYSIKFQIKMFSRYYSYY